MKLKIDLHTNASQPIFHFIKMVCRVLYMNRIILYLINKMPISMRQFLKFGIVGLTNTCIDFFIYSLLVYCGAYPLLANVVSFTCGAFNSFYSNKNFTFKKEDESNFHKNINIRFIIINLITLLFSQVILWIALLTLGSPMSGKIISIFATFIIGFFMNKIFVFKLTKI